MSALLHVILWLIIAAVALWTLIFGGIGVAIARVRAKSLWSGFAWGFCLGPIGWLVLLLAPRSLVHQANSSAARDRVIGGPVPTTLGGSDTDGAPEVM